MDPSASNVRRLLARSPAARRAVAKVRQQVCPPAPAVSGAVDYWAQAPEDAVRTAFQVVLGRNPDPTGLADYGGRLAAGSLTPDGLVDELLASEEADRRHELPGRFLHVSVHASRKDFIRSLPPARRILDIGGGWKWSADGALVVLGYPYAFEELVIVDLPSDDRHPLYQSEDHGDAVQTRLGPVRYDYRSMTDLSNHPDDSYDLVYSGQSIEHVTPKEGDVVLGEVFRVLRPGGVFALDTPNGAVCRLQQADFIDADHEVEYTHTELTEKLVAAGFTLREQKGLNFCGESVRSGEFSWAEAARNRGIYSDPERCYLLAYLATKG